MDSIEKVLMWKKPRIGRRTQAYIKLIHLCFEDDLTESQIMSILYRADNKWKKYVGKTNREASLRELINHVRERRGARA